MIINAPKNFSLDACLVSHGWVQLAPFHVADGSLATVFRHGSSVVSAAIRAASAKEDSPLKVQAAKGIADAETVSATFGRILRFDEDLEGLYRLTDRHRGMEWIRQRGAGRLVRSPTVWEDLVKTICTTNCSWALTLNMVNNLVEKLGEAGRDGKMAFPTPEAMASADESFYRNEIRAGYRSPYFAELAKKTAGGDIDPESWLRSPLATPELKKSIKGVKGVGDYAAENLLKLLGRYDGLALDSWLRAQFYNRHNGGKPCPDAKIERHYAGFGEWRGLAIWCDMTRDWHLKGRDSVSNV